MTDKSENNTEHESPEEQALAALEKAINAISNVDANDKVAVAKAENQAAHQLASELADAVRNGFASPDAKSLCGSFAQEASNYTKTDLKDLLSDKIEDGEDADLPPFNQVLKEGLDRVLVLRTTDARQNAIYRFHFKDGVVETKATADGRTHFDWSRFRDEYYDATGKRSAQPVKDLRSGEAWRRFITELIAERGESKTNKGPRTVAVERLQNWIRRTTAYPTVAHMCERDGVRVDGNPLNGEATEIWVQNHHIKRICDEAELSSTRALQSELDAQGYVPGRINGISETTHVNRNKVTYWVLSAEIAEPAAYEEDPKDPAEMVREEKGDDEDDDDTEPGVIGSTGGDDE